MVEARTELLEISFNGSDKRTVAALLAKTDTVIGRLTLKLNELMIRLQSKIVGEKLEGQVLHHRTGKLIESIRVLPPTTQSSNLVAGVQGAGGPAWYGRLHEFGYTYTREAGTRRIGFDVKGEITHLLMRAKRVRSSVSTIKEIAVRSYTVHIPERSFMRTSQAEMAETIQAEMKEAVDDAIKQ